jgi:undecaprenyl diphosphate synthase
MNDKEYLPVHIAIIMDGNGRWAEKRGLPRVAGHRAGMDTIHRIVEASYDIGIKILTLFAFSTENWQRPKDEVRALMGFIGEYLDRETPYLMKNGIKFSAIGFPDEMPVNARTKIVWAQEKTRSNDSLLLNVAVNYGGRREIVEAAKNLARKSKAGLMDPESIDECIFESELQTAGLPDPDLLIRTSGEFRVSNFLLWQLAYTEVHISPVLWPDFQKEHLQAAICEYRTRERRFGRI